MKAKDTGAANLLAAFAASFSYEDWCHLCTQADFLEAVEIQDFTQAKRLARQHLSTWVQTANEGRP